MSGSRSGFSIQITAVDAATKQIDAINARIRAMQAPAERLTKSFGKLADNTGITRLGTGMRNLARELLQAFENIGRMAGPLGAITGAASIAGLVRLTTSFGDFGNRTQIAARRAGLGAEQFLDLGNAARLAGSSAEAMGAGMTALKDNIFDINAGRAAPTTIAAFNTLGITLRDKVTGQLRSSTDVLPELATALSKVQDPTQRATLELLTLGGSGAALDPLMRLGARGVAGLIDQAKALYGVTDAQIKASVEFHQKTEAMTIATEGLGIAIAADLLPVLGPVLTQMTNWIIANKDWISSDIKGFVSAAIPKITEFASEANAVATALGGWKTVLEGIVGIAAVRWVAGIMTSLSPLTLALGAIVLTMQKISEFETNSLAKNLPIGSPLWRDIPDTEQSNYVNSPRSQSFLHPDGQNPYPFSLWNPGSWLNRGKGPSSGAPTADVTMDPTKRGFLDTIAGPESGGAYDVKNGGSRFTDFSQFPEGVGPGGTSSASGRYQLTSGTWQSERRKLGLSDFSAANQDKAAWDLAATTYRARTGGDLETDIRAGNKTAQIASALNPTWPSLPGGSQSLESQDRFDSELVKHLAANAGPRPAGMPGAAGMPSAAPAGAPAAAPGFDASGKPLPVGWMAPPANIQGGSGTSAAAPTPSTTTVRGSASLNIKLDGFPAGTRTMASTDGDLFNGAPRVETAMPVGGGS